jgi:hypothetical protein
MLVEIGLELVTEELTRIVTAERLDFALELGLPACFHHLPSFEALVLCCQQFKL